MRQKYSLNDSLDDFPMYLAKFPNARRMANDILSEMAYHARLYPTVVQKELRAVTLFHTDDLGITISAKIQESPPKMEIGWGWDPFGIVRIVETRAAFNASVLAELFTNWIRDPFSPMIVLFTIGEEEFLEGLIDNLSDAQLRLFVDRFLQAEFRLRVGKTTMCTQFGVEWLNRWFPYDVLIRVLRKRGIDFKNRYEELRHRAEAALLLTR